jgi:hypothetical protein
MKLSELKLHKSITQVERAIEAGQSPILYSAGDLDPSLTYLVNKYNYYIFESWVTFDKRYNDFNPVKLFVKK